MKNIIDEITILIPILVTLFTIGWFYSFKTKVFSWLDFLWSSSFIVVVLFHHGFQWSILDLLYIIWSLRLSIHLFTRIKKHGEDRRYIELKNNWKVWYGVQFFIIFQVEALLTLILAIPLFLTYQGPTTIIQYLAIGLFAIAIAGETLADHQLKKFLSLKREKAEVCNIGLWKYSRHPNYFFEWMIWVSFALFSTSSVEKWPGLLPAIIMYFVLTKVTGIPYAEASSLKSKGDLYKSYQKTTNAFIPWFPKILLAFAIVLLPHSKPSYAAGENMIQQEKIKTVFNELRADNLHILDNFYDPNTEFVDPVGVHKGLDSVKSYYKGLYQNVKDIHFEYRDLISQDNTHVLIWKMTLSAPGLNGGNPVTLEGNSYIKFNDKNLVIYHRDYFDMGEFIYEHIPVLGWTLRKIKTKLRGHE